MLKIVHAIEGNRRTNSVIIHRPSSLPAENLTGSKPKILIVDDDSTVLKTTSELLQKDYEVETATNISEAMEKLNSGSFHLLLTDWNLDRTNEDGINLAKQAKEKHPDLKTMLHSANAFKVIDSQNFDNLDAIIDKGTHQLSELISSVLYGDDVDKRIKLASEVQRGKLEVLKQVEDGRALNISVIADDERINAQVQTAMDILLDKLHAMDIIAFDLNEAGEGDKVLDAVRNIQRVTMQGKTGDRELSLNPAEIVFVEDGLFSHRKIETLSQQENPPMIVLVKERFTNPYQGDFTSVDIGNIDDTVLVLAEALIKKYTA